MTLTEAIAARGLDPVRAVRLELARAKTRAARIKSVPIIPGRDDAARWAMTSHRRSENFAIARDERALLERTPEGSERTREYIRVFERLNHLTHATVWFDARSVDEDEDDADDWDRILTQRRQAQIARAGLRA